MEADMHAPSELRALGYVGLHAKTVEDWADVGSRVFGLQPVERTRSSLRFRMDDRAQRIVVQADGGQGTAFIGFEADDAAAVDRLAARLEANRVPVTPMTAALADERRVAGGIVFADPLGNRLEAVHGADIADTPFQPGRTMSGFRTGALGMGHLVFDVPQMAPMLAFYRDLLGFRLSDYILRPFQVYFLHLNARHHSIGLIERGQAGAHHMMIETFMLDDVGQGYDLALDEEGRVAQTLGRHINDMMTSFYAHTPSGVLLEYGWGGRSIDVARWVPEEVTHGPSLWGHERLYMPPALRAQAREMRERAAAEGVRAPVQVMEGNYDLAPGECPWFEGLRRAG